MKALLLKTERGLRGSSPADQEAYQRFKRRLESMKPGTWIRMEWSSPRHPKHHRKFFALLQLITENSEVYNTIEKALVAVKLCTGHFDLMADPRTGEIIQIPNSIAFEAMPQEEFDVFYSAAIDAVMQVILPQLDRARADRLLEMVIEGWV